MWALHRALENRPGAYAPYEWRISRYCEEFHCTPSVARRELEIDPERLGNSIMMLRSYASLKAAVDRRIAGSKEEIPDSPMLRTVLKNVERLVSEQE